MGDSKEIGKLLPFPLPAKQRVLQELDEQWIEGEARCLSCSHEWRAVTPVGIVEFECPACELLKGVWYTNILPDPDKAEYWQCGNCEGNFFTLVRYEETVPVMHCLTCGKAQEF